MSILDNISTFAAAAFAPAASANSTAPAASAGTSTTGADTPAPGSPTQAYDVPLPYRGTLRLGDVADALPPRARRRLLDLRDAQATARAVQLTLMDRRDEANVATITIAPRSDVDPRAFLLLSSDMPAPNKETF
jgi:hypothetical protein